MYEVIGVGLILGVAIGWALGIRRLDPERPALKQKIVTLEEANAELRARLDEAHMQADEMRGLEKAAVEFVQVIGDKIRAPEWLDESEFLLVDRDWGWIRRALAWADAARETWSKIDQLSPSGRRNLEEDCIRAQRGETVVKTELLEGAMNAMACTPKGVTKNLFELKRDDFDRFVGWAQIVESISVPAYRELRTFIANVPESAADEESMWG
jgi:hypothetical protein